MANTVVDVLNELLAAWNEHDAGRVARVCAPDCEVIDVGEADPLRGRDAIRASCERYLAAFPDLRIRPEAPIIDGDRASLTYTATGTQRGSLLHIPPTGKVVTVRGAWFATIQQGQVNHLLTVWDLAGLLRTFGLLPDL